MSTLILGFKKEIFKVWTLPDLVLLTDLCSTPSLSFTPIFSGFSYQKKRNTNINKQIPELHVSSRVFKSNLVSLLMVSLDSSLGVFSLCPHSRGLNLQSLQSQPFPFIANVSRLKCEVKSLDSMAILTPTRTNPVVLM